MRVVLKTLISGLFVLSFVFAQNEEARLSEINDLVNNGQYTEAENGFKSLLADAPTYAPAMLEFSKFYLRIGDREKAFEQIKGAVEVDYDTYNPEFEKINQINTNMADGMRSMNNALYDEAFASFKKVLDENPFFAEAAYSMGLARFREKNYEDAVNYFQKTLEIYSDHENAKASIDNVTKNTFNDGNNAYRRGDLDGALASYKQVLDYNKNFYQAWYQIAVIEAKFGNLDGAIDAYNSALAIAPTFYKGWFALGLSLSKAGDAQGAINAFEKAVEIYPGYGKAYVSMGEVYLELKQLDNAIEKFKLATTVEPSYAKGYEFLGVAYLEQENHDGAKAALEIASSLDDSNVNVWYRLAHSYNSLGECEKGRNAAIKATDLKRNFGAGWYELGLAEWCNGSGNKTAALNAFEKARNDRTWRTMAEFEIDKIKNPQKYQD